MDEIIIQRVRLYLENQQISQADIARLISSTNDLVSKWFTLKQKMPFGYFILLLKNLPELNVRWLMTGEGEMTSDNKDEGSTYNNKNNKGGFEPCDACKRENILLNKLNKLLEEQKEALEEKIKELENLNKKKPQEKIGFIKDKDTRQNVDDNSIKSLPITGRSINLYEMAQLAIRKV
jgi:transcriptional regulator with XRE-family HTH domain